jgi:hypothetical protein
MPFEPVTFAPSSNIKGVQYDADSQSLRVEYSRGHVYVYAGVTTEMAAGFNDADSATGHLRQAILPLAVETVEK